MAGDALDARMKKLHQVTRQAGRQAGGHGVIAYIAVVTAWRRRGHTGPWQLTCGVHLIRMLEEQHAKGHGMIIMARPTAAQQSNMRAGHGIRPACSMAGHAHDPHAPLSRSQAWPTLGLPWREPGTLCHVLCPSCLSHSGAARPRGSSSGWWTRWRPARQRLQRRWAQAGLRAPCPSLRAAPGRSWQASWPPPSSRTSCRWVGWGGQAGVVLSSCIKAHTR